MLRLPWLLIVAIIGGINAEISQDDCTDITKHPYTVSIMKNGRHVCSGVILDQHHIVTSDRCVPPFRHTWNLMNNIVVATGTSTLKPYGREMKLIKEMFSQNHYANPSSNPVTSGLGVLKLLIPLRFGDKVQPIEISEVEKLPSDAKLQVVGWMMASHEGKKTACLKETTLEMVDPQTCQKSHEKTLTESEFCTQPLAESRLCKGDSGSPVIYEGKLVGVTTYGISCNKVPVPDVHPNMHKNIEYLNGIIKE